MFRIFEDSAPFSLVIKQRVQDNTSSEQKPFHWGPRFHIGCRGLGWIQTLRTKKQSVRLKPLKSRRPYGRWNRNQGAFVPLVEHDEHITERDNLAKTLFQQNACSLGKSCQNCWRQWNEKAQNTTVRNNTVQGPS